MMVPANSLQDYAQRILRPRVYDAAVETPLENMPRISEQLSRTVLLKREDLQPIFSFKLRGAYNKIVRAARYPAKVGSSAAPQPRHHNPRRQLPLEGKASQRALAEAHRAKQAARSLRRNGGRAASGLLHFRKTKGGHFRMPLRGQIRTSQSQGDSCHAGEGETALSLGLVDFVVSDLNFLDKMPTFAVGAAPPQRRRRLGHSDCGAVPRRSGAVMAHHRTGCG
jgi:hypothetical protein